MHKKPKKAKKSQKKSKKFKKWLAKIRKQVYNNITQSEKSGGKYFMTFRYGRRRLNAGGVSTFPAIFLISNNIKESV